ncbi:YeeE/YedE family protein [Candidatus Sumerlaeota bacterium]|nr:YeeE/YedE family protein [Candidatus Sumerlaeota bacterium]
MLTNLHSQKKPQLGIGLILGILFGFFLQKGGVTNYDVIISQLLFNDFTVVKIMLTAMLTGMIGVHILRSLGFAELHPKPGSFGMSAIGGLIFGVGFGTLGYCPGTVMGAVGEGNLDALFGGVAGILIGAAVFAALYPKLEKGVLLKGAFGTMTFPEVFKVNPWILVAPVSIMVIVLLFWIEKSGF